MKLVSVATRFVPDCGAAATAVGGGRVPGMARHPAQQLSAQTLLLVPPGEGVDRSAMLLWQRMLGCAAASAATSAAPKLAMTPENAIA